MNVTIKAAMDMAIRALQEKEQTEEVTQAIHRLQQLAKRDLVAQWSRESILEALENWRKAHDGQAPTVTALAEPGMPGCNIIQKHFGMRASAFLRQQYPQKVTPRHRPNRYGFTMEQDWLDCFREQFEKHCLDEGFSSKTYNVLRDKNTPLWATIAYNVGTSQWGELMQKAGVSYPNRQQNADPARMHMGVAYHPLYDQLEECLKRAEEHRKLLIEGLERTAVRTRYLDAYLELKAQESPYINRVPLETLNRLYKQAPEGSLSDPKPSPEDFALVDASVSKSR